MVLRNAVGSRDKQCQMGGHWIQNMSRHARTNKVTRCQESIAWLGVLLLEVELSGPQKIIQCRALGGVERRRIGRQN